MHSLQINAAFFSNKLSSEDFSNCCNHPPPPITYFYILYIFIILSLFTFHDKEISNWWVVLNALNSISKLLHCIPTCISNTSLFFFLVQSFSSSIPPLNRFKTPSFRFCRLSPWSFPHFCPPSKPKLLKRVFHSHCCPFWLLIPCLNPKIGIFFLPLLSPSPGHATNATWASCSPYLMQFLSTPFLKLYPFDFCDTILSFAPDSLVLTQPHSSS